jgi:hypothetical protein
MWNRYVEHEEVLEFFKKIDIKEYLTPLNPYSQGRVIEKIFELKKLTGESELLSKLSHDISNFLPDMDPSVQKTFVKEAFDLRNTESGAKVAKGLLAKVCENLPKMDKSVSTYLESNSYFITSPTKYDPNYYILSASFNTEVFSLLAEKAKTDNDFIKQLILTGNTTFKEIADREIFSSQDISHMNGEVIKTLILTGEKDKILLSFKLSDIHNKKEQIKSLKEIFSLWHDEKELQKDILDILRSSYVNFLPEVAQEVQEAFIEELFDAKGIGLGHFTAFYKGNYELLIDLLPQVVAAFSSEKVDSKIKYLFLTQVFDLQNDDYSHIGLSPVLHGITNLIDRMDTEMSIRFINKLKNFKACWGYEIGLKKQIYLKLIKFLDVIIDEEVQKLFVKQVMEMILNPESESFDITIEEILSDDNLNQTRFIESLKDLIISSPHPDKINKLWVPISKSLQSLDEYTQIAFLKCSFDLIKTLNLQESLSFKTVILEINKLIGSKDAFTQLSIFNQLKQMEISQTIFSQALKTPETVNIQEYLEIEAEKWLMEKVREGKTEDLSWSFSYITPQFLQQFAKKLLNSDGLSPKNFLQIILSKNYVSSVQQDFLITVFHTSKFSYDYDYLGRFLGDLLNLRPLYFSHIFEQNKRYISKAKIFHCHEAGTISDELYQTIINQLGGKDKFFDPSLKLVISQDIDPLVKKLFDKAIYSKDIEGRVKDIALTVDLLVKKDTSGLMKTILEAADLPGKLLMENDLHSSKPNTYLQGTYSPNKDIKIFSMDRQSNVEVAGTIIHELTHKLLQFIFENYAYPYYNATLSLSQVAYLSQILNELVLIPQQHKLFSYYDKDKWNVEVIPHLFQDLATRILTGEDSETVLVLSEKLNNWVTSYLKQPFQDFDSAYKVLGSKILTEYSSQPKFFKNWSQERIDKELEKISNIQKIADEESTDSFDITGTILGYLEQPEETALEVAGES